MALGTDEAVEAFCSGKAVLGEDFSLTLMGEDDSADSQNAFDRCGTPSCLQQPLLDRCSGRSC